MQGFAARAKPGNDGISSGGGHEAVAPDRFHRGNGHITMALTHDRGRIDFAAYQPQHFLWSLEGQVGTITLNRPERKNPLTFESYAELRDLFRALAFGDAVKAVVITGAGGNFCSGGDVHEIIGPLVRMQEAGDTQGLLDFTRMTGDLVKAMRACPQVIVAAVDGICAGAGAILAMASDLRLGTAGSKVAFLFTRVGLAGADMGACNILPRIIGAGRAADLLYTGRAMGGEEAERWGFYNRLCPPEAVLQEAQALAQPAPALGRCHRMKTKSHGVGASLGLVGGQAVALQRSACQGLATRARSTRSKWVGSLGCSSAASPSTTRARPHSLIRWRLA